MTNPIAITTLRTSIVLGLRLVIQAGTLVALARALGPTEFGAYAALGALAVLLGTLATFGTHLTLLRDVARTPSTRDVALQRALGTTVTCGVALLCLYIVLCVFWLALDVSVAIIVWIGIAELLLQPIFMIAATERQACGEVARSQLLLTFPLLFRLLTALAVGIWNPQHPLVVFTSGYLLAVALALSLVVITAPRAWPAPWRWRMMDSSGWKDASGYALQGASATGASEIDKVLAGKLMPGDAAGIYAAASRVVGASVLPVIALVLSAMPRLFRESVLEIRSSWPRMLTAAGIYGMVAGGSLWLCSSWFSPLFGDRYKGLEDTIAILAFAVPAISVRAVAANALVTFDQPWLRARLDLSSWLLLPTLAWLLIPSMGSHGLAWAVTSTEWMLATTSSAVVWKSLGLR